MSYVLQTQHSRAKGNRSAKGYQPMPESCNSDPKQSVDQGPDTADDNAVLPFHDMHPDRVEDSKREACNENITSYDMSDFKSDGSKTLDLSALFTRLEVERKDELSLMERQAFERLEVLMEDSSLHSDSSLLQKIVCKLKKPGSSTRKLADVSNVPTTSAPFRALPDTNPAIPLDSGIQTSRTDDLKEYPGANTQSIVSKTVDNLPAMETADSEPENNMEQERQISVVHTSPPTTDSCSLSSMLDDTPTIELLANFTRRNIKATFESGNENWFGLKVRNDQITTASGSRCFAGMERSPRVHEIDNDEQEALAHAGLSDNPAQSSEVFNSTIPIPRLPPASGAPRAVTFCNAGETPVFQLADAGRSASGTYGCESNINKSAVCKDEQLDPQLAEIRQLSQQLDQAQNYVDGLKEKYESLVAKVEKTANGLDAEKESFAKFRDTEIARLKAYAIRVEKSDKAAQNVLKRDNEEIKCLKKRIVSMDHDRCETEAKLCEEKSGRREERNRFRKEIEELRSSLDRERKKSDTAQKTIDRLEEEKLQLKNRLRNLVRAKEQLSSIENRTGDKATTSAANASMASRRSLPAPPTVSTTAQVPNTASSAQNPGSQKQVRFSLPDVAQLDSPQSRECSVPADSTQTSVSGNNTSDGISSNLVRSDSYDVMDSAIPRHLLPTILSAVASVNQTRNQKNSGHSPNTACVCQTAESSSSRSNQVRRQATNDVSTNGSRASLSSGSGLEEDHDDDEIIEAALGVSDSITKKPPVQPSKSSLAAPNDADKMSSSKQTKKKTPQAKMTLERKLPGGWTEMHYDNGTVERTKQVGPGGKRKERMLHYKNGDSLQIMADGTKVYFYAAKRLVETIDKDGKKTTKCWDGSSRKMLVDGTFEKELEDGSKLTQFPDGVTMREKPDGTRYVITPNYKSVEKPDGWIWRKYLADGYEELCDPSGQLVQQR